MEGNVIGMYKHNLQNSNLGFAFPMRVVLPSPSRPHRRVPRWQTHMSKMPINIQCKVVEGSVDDELGWKSFYEASESFRANNRKDRGGSHTSLEDLVNSLLEKQTSGHLLPSDVALAWYLAIEVDVLIDNSSSGSLVKVLLRMAGEHHSAMDPKSVSTLVWALTKAELGETSLFPSIYSHQTAESLVNFEPGEVTILLWAAATHPKLEASSRVQPFQQLVILVESGLDLSLFTFYELSVLIWSMGQVGYSHPALIDAVQQSALKKVELMTPPDASRLLYGFSLLNTNPVTLLSALTKHCEKCIGDFTATDLALFLTSLGRLCLEPETSFLKAIDKRTGEFISNSIPKIKKSSSKKAAVNGSKVYHSSGLDVSPNQIASLAWSFARMGHKPLQGGFMIKSLKHLEIYTDLYSIREVTAILWACSTLGITVPSKTLVAIARYIDATMVRTNPKPPISTLVRTVNYMASGLARSKNGLAATEQSLIQTCLLKVTKAYVGSIKSGKIVASDLSHVLIALGALDIKPTTEVSGFVSCCQDLQQACVMAAEDFSVNTYPKVAWALVRLKWGKNPAFDAIINAAVSRCALMSPQALVQITWACASMKRPFPNLIPTLVTHCLAKLRYLDAKRKVRLAWSYARLLNERTAGQPDQAALASVIDSLSKEDIGQLEPPSIAALLWACGKLDRNRGDRALGFIGNYMTKKTNQFSHEELRLASFIFSQHSDQTQVVQAIKKEMAYKAKRVGI